MVFYTFLYYIGIDPSEKKLEMTGDILEIFWRYSMTLIHGALFMFICQEILWMYQWDVVSCSWLLGQNHITTSEQQLVGGWATYPSEKWWSESQLGWFSIPNWMESHKSHVPNHQPGKMTGIHAGSSRQKMVFRSWLARKTLTWAGFYMLKASKRIP